MNKDGVYYVVCSHRSDSLRSRMRNEDLCASDLLREYAQKNPVWEWGKQASQVKQISKEAISGLI